MNSNLICGANHRTWGISLTSAHLQFYLILMAVKNLVTLRAGFFISSKRTQHVLYLGPWGSISDAPELGSKLSRVLLCCKVTPELLRA